MRLTDFPEIDMNAWFKSIKKWDEIQVSAGINQPMVFTIGFRMKICIFVVLLFFLQ